jgi:hypothetical protein
MRILLVLLALLWALPVEAQVSGPWAKVVFGSDAGPFDSSGEDSPENVVVACPSSTYRQTNGAAGNVFWVKDGGTGCDATGWIILAGGGGGGSHNLLSATHSDTAANAAVRGAAIIGNSSPAWARLTPTTAGQVLRFGGTDTEWSVNGSLFEDLNATEITSGTLPDARLSANVSLLGSSIASSEITDATIVFADWASNSCSSNQIPKWSGAAWACATDETGSTVYAPADASYITASSESGLSNETILGSASHSWADGVKQTFNPNGTNAGINVGSHAGDPGSPANGDLWYDSVANELTARINGSTVALGAGGGGHVIEDEGTPLTARSSLNFVGSGVTCTDDSGNDETDCTISGGAAGAWSLRMGPQSNHPPGSSPATWDTRNGRGLLDFDPDADEFAIFESTLPAGYAGGGITVQIKFSMTSAVADDVVICAAIERNDDEGLDTDSDSFASDVCVTVAAPTTTGQVQYASIDLDHGSEMDSLAAGEFFRLRISRDANNGSDDAAGDLELRFVTVVEQ